MRFRWTIKELEEKTDEEMLLGICSERQTDCTNIYSPLYKRLSKIKDNLERKIKEQKDKNDGNKHVEILQHNISYYLRDTDLDIDEGGIDHIKDMIIAGYISGELVLITSDEKEYHGWWEIIKQ